MHTHDLHKWQHDHTFDQDKTKAGERATVIVIIITGVTMIVEIIAGLAFGSMALLADGLHMASHTVALGISVFAYVYARRFSSDPRFSFGTGKVNALAAFTSAILLVGFALTMVIESVDRMLNPVQIAFSQALVVAVVGLVVNVVSAWILASSGEHHHHDHGHDHGGHHTDHNLRAAYLHVVTDALTSILAIVALMAGKWIGLGWMDPLMGIVGATVVTHWSIGLMKTSGRVLLDWQASDKDVETLRQALQVSPDDRIADVHIWAIAPGKNLAEIVIVGHGVKDPNFYRARIPASLNIAHATIEIHECKS